MLYNKAFNDIKDAVRRTTNDLDTNQVAIQEHQLSEFTITEFINLSHEAGQDPRTPTRPTSEAQELSYPIAVGEFQTAVEDSADIVAVDHVYTNLSTRPLQFLPRHEIDAMIQNDIQRNGAVKRSDPAYWSMVWTQGTKSGNVAAVMQHRLLLYPAAIRAYTVYWPRTIVDITTVDPSITTGRPPFSYQLMYALIYKLASICIGASTDDSLKRNNVNRELGQTLWQQYKDAMAREKQERASFFQHDYIRGLAT